MAKDTLEQILNVEAAAGPFSTGDAVIEQTLRDFIQLQSTTIAVGTKVVGVRSVPWMDFKWYTGVNGSFSFPLDDNAVVDPTKIGTENYATKLEKGQGRVTFLDSVRLRGESWENIDRQQLGIIRARADKIDATILAALAAGAGLTLAASAAFGSAGADEEGDLLSAMDKIFEHARVSGDEPMALILPASKRSAMLNTQLFGNVVESLADHMGRIANLTVYYSRDSAVASDALLLIPGAETAEFFQYNGEGFMETELTRLPGVGFDWLLTSFMGTVIHEHQDEADDGTAQVAGKNSRILKITGVA
mgnify:FL=1|tara:strand:- start:428 stop:1342 length:915 start_codon:yes stop_codon:yes gene_type:complete